MRFVVWFSLLLYTVCYSCRTCGVGWFMTIKYVSFIPHKVGCGLWGGLVYHYILFVTYYPHDGLRFEYSLFYHYIIFAICSPQGGMTFMVWVGLLLHIVCYLFSTGWDESCSVG